MKDALSVITDATKGFVIPLAQRREISERRMHEQLGDQCVYPKSKRLIRDIAAVNKYGARLIKADMDAMWFEIFGDTPTRNISTLALHREAFEAIDALMAGKAPAECAKELRELIAIAQEKLEEIEAEAGASNIANFKN